MLNKPTQRYFAETDNRPPPGVKRMTVRRTECQRFGPYQIVMETSCGSTKPHLAGSVRIRLYESRADEPDEAVAVKRFQVEHWREAQDEMRRLRFVLAEPA